MHDDPTEPIGPERDESRNDHPIDATVDGDTTAPLTPAVDRPAAGTTMPAQIGGYTITRVLGEGGMGLVYEAKQRHPERAVALKVVRAGYLSPQMLRRFVLESSVLGRLQHPGIAQVYEAGTATDDRGHEVPFFAMEYVRGVTLTRYAEQRSLGTRQRLELLASICDAVNHAHQKGVIHRDLKPGNILVDETGQPKILDFGVARATDCDIQQTTMQTDIGQLIGTVPYMSPEQVSGDPSDLDTRSDVYALGVIAYELLAGQLPYDLQKVMIHEAVRVIREEEPTRLSSINRTLRGDVETIVAKALEKDKTRRYPSAESLATDIRRYLNNETITARPASGWYQVRKFARRNRALVAGVAAAFVLLTAGLIGTGYGLLEARKQEVLALQAAASEAEQRATAGARAEEAEAARARAEAAEAEAEQRAEELQLVADFQAAQLGTIQVAAMGEQLRASIIDASPEEQTESLVQGLAEVNFSDIARGTLESNIFVRTIDAIDSQFEDQPLVRAQLLQSVAGTLIDLSMLELATDPQQRALEIRRVRLGDEHPDTLSSMNSMGLLLVSQSKLTEAEPYVREVLETRRRVLGDEHEHTLTAINNMGGLLSARGLSAEAEPFISEALEIARRVLGDERPDTIAALNSMGTVLLEQSKFAEAEPYLREALEIGRRVLGDEDPETIRAVESLGIVLAMQGKLAEAEPYFLDALETNRRMLGNEHRRTLKAINNMGALLDAQGRLVDAEPYFRDALATSRRVLGNEHRDTLQFTANVGRLLEARGELAEAFDLLLPGARTAEAALPESDPVRRELRERVVSVALALHENEPNAGYDNIAAEWQARAGEADKEASDD